MKKANLIIISVLATVLLSGMFMSLAVAQESTPSEPPLAPDQPLTTDGTLPDSPDNSTLTSGGDPILYALDDNSTDANSTRTPNEVPASEDGILIATNTASDNTLPIVVIAVLIAVIVGGAIGVIYYRRKASHIED
ncbi:MAG: hypothetical protein NWE98_04715 [Candidatus Bathyarchaeota archaeon]|nr:hypothetical protein [Candidatus Bathyarchaeota archaeon]